MSIDLSSANNYFGKEVHVKSGVWMAFSNDHRKSAIAMSKRDLSLLLNPDDYPDGLSEDTTVDGDFPRHDVAVYEQALHMLINSGILADGDERGPMELADSIEDDGGDGKKSVKERKKEPPKYSPEALRFLMSYKDRMRMLRIELFRG